MSLLEAVLWLTLNVYHEARSEPQIGQVYVAQVTMNRAKSRNLPIKEVVQQPFQFSWYGKKLFPKDITAFQNCLESVFLAAASDDLTDNAQYYHRVDVSPKWREAYTMVAKINKHIFYKE